ncbi:MAG: threonine synthase [Eubacteriales bacterium]
MDFISTRDEQETSSLLAIIKGIADSGGLFVPEKFPELTIDEIVSFKDMPYYSVCAKVINKYIDELTEKEIEDITMTAYSGFDTKEVAPLVKLDENKFILELWHGKTLAFKDMALSVLPSLLAIAKKKKGNSNKTFVLVATSGDTGKAALSGFMDAPMIDICVFYPNEGVSKLQELQMVTQEGKNTHVIAVNGNFDECQTGVKKIFADSKFKKLLNDKGYELSSANSINFGRLVPQIVYYINSYAKLVKNGDIAKGEMINIAVPTGNFGNILAAYYAKRMGLPVKKLICASNANNVLTDFFKSGNYSLDRKFYKTISPSMDILISSNLERLLYEITGRDKETVSKWMIELKDKKGYSISEKLNQLNEFYAGWVDEEGTRKTIKETFDKYNYLIDTHTAVAVKVYNDYIRETGDKTKTIIASTANPYKFVFDVLNIFTDEKFSDEDVFGAVNRLNEITGAKIPKNIAELEGKKILHTKTVEKNEMQQAVLDIIK